MKKKILKVRAKLQIHKKTGMKNLSVYWCVTSKINSWKHVAPTFVIQISITIGGGVSMNSTFCIHQFP